MAICFLFPRMKPQLNLVSWNLDGFKTGHCSAPPVGQVSFKSGPQINLPERSCERVNLLTVFNCNCYFIIAVLAFMSGKQLLYQGYVHRDQFSFF